MGLPEVVRGEKIEREQYAVYAFFCGACGKQNKKFFGQAHVFLSVDTGNAIDPSARLNTYHSYPVDISGHDRQMILEGREKDVIRKIKAGHDAHVHNTATLTVL